MTTPAGTPPGDPGATPDPAVSPPPSGAEPRNGPDGAPGTPEGSPGATDADTPPEGEHDPANAEAARYRKQLRTVEAERDGLRQRVDAVQRAEVLRVAAESLADPEDFWLSGQRLQDLRDESGDIDAEKVRAAVGDLVAARPHWKRSAPARPDVSTLRSGANPSGEGSAASWSSVLRGE